MKGLPGSSSVSPEELATHRDVLLRFALLHLRDQPAAEDAVQDTLLAALDALDTFRGESSLQTWLVGILKRRLVDHFRRQQRQVDATEVGLDRSDADDAGLLTQLFDRSGKWVSAPRPWPDPYAAMEQAGFWQAFEECIRHLPARQARAFVLRELVGLEAAEICKELAINPSNYWVLLHRARLRLRDCLEQHWFSGQSPEGNAS
jgi:RNA polymerase sigma-70 factor (ECF subfamily)